MMVAPSQRGVVAVVMVGVVVGGGRGRRRVAEGWRDGRGLDGDDAGVHDLTVDLHHHLVTLRGVIQTLCGGRKGGVRRMRGRKEEERKKRKNDGRKTFTGHILFLCLSSGFNCSINWLHIKMNDMMAPIKRGKNTLLAPWWLDAVKLINLDHPHVSRRDVGQTKRLKFSKIHLSF